MGSVKMMISGNCLKGEAGRRPAGRERPRPGERMISKICIFNAFKKPAKIPGRINPVLQVFRDAGTLREKRLKSDIPYFDIRITRISLKKRDHAFLTIIRISQIKQTLL